MPASLPFPITAYGGCNGLGVSLVDMTEGLAAGRRGLSACPFQIPFDTVLGTVPGDFPAPPSEYQQADSRILRLALLGYRQVAGAVENAIAHWGPERVGVVLGTSTGGLSQTELAFDKWCAEGFLPDTYCFETQHGMYAFARVIAHMAGARGPSYVISTACTSSGKVFGCAQRLLASGTVDAVLVGGADSLCHTTVRGFHSLGVLAAEPCRPFAAHRPGMNVGEGSGFMLIEKQRLSGKDPHAWLLGVGETSDAHHMSSPHPEGRGAMESMRAAVRQAGRSLEDVDYINAHGTGTQRNDSVEARAIYDVFGDRVLVSSTKGYTGHMLGASAITEAIFCIFAIGERLVPTSLGAEPIDPEVKLQVVHKRKTVACRLVVSNSFAFGGNNVSLALGVEP